MKTRQIRVYENQAQWLESILPLTTSQTVGVIINLVQHSQNIQNAMMNELIQRAELVNGIVKTEDMLSNLYIKDTSKSARPVGRPKLSQLEKIINLLKRQRDLASFDRIYDNRMYEMIDRANLFCNPYNLDNYEDIDVHELSDVPEEWKEYISAAYNGTELPIWFHELEALRDKLASEVTG